MKLLLNATIALVADPSVYEMDKLVSFDIDWPEDFVLAEKIAASGVVKF